MKRFIILLLFFALNACNKNAIDPDNNVGTIKFPPSPVSGSVTGIVLDANNIPVNNAAVTINSNAYTTNNDGRFSTGIITLDKHISTVKVEKQGYYPGFRSFAGSASQNNISIKLISKTLTGSFSSDGPGVVTLSNGSSLSFQANGMVLKGTNTPYSGSVNIYASYIDPTAADFGSTVPGSLIGEDDTRFYVLRSTGMLAVELEGMSGEQLELATGKPATVKTLIPTALVDEAPSTITTWALDERGVWIKEGLATKVGNAYLSDLEHFSFWNWASQATSVSLTVNVTEQGYPLRDIWVSLTSSTTYGTTWGVTDTLGNVTGYVPANEILELGLFTMPGCGSSFYNGTVGPFTTSTSIGVAGSPGPSTFRISGYALNCAGDSILNGWVNLIMEPYMRFSFINGYYSFQLPSCYYPSTLSIIIEDQATLQHGPSVMIPVSGNVIQAGTISGCGFPAHQQITYQVDGTTFSLNNSNTSAGLDGVKYQDYTIISCYDQSNQVEFRIDGSGLGTFPIRTTEPMFVNSFYDAIALSTASATITTYGEIGYYIEGSFNIPFTSGGAVHSLTGTFRVKRIQ